MRKRFSSVVQILVAGAGDAVDKSLAVSIPAILRTGLVTIARDVMKYRV